jgi:N-acetylmuramoyl-L-alanine amidase
MSLLAMALGAQMTCLAQNVYFEARNQSYSGQMAVSHVVLNRVEDPRFPDNICDVVKQARTDENGNLIRHRCQFSWYCDGLSDVPKNEEAWMHAVMVAQEAVYLYNSGTDITNGADHYHAKNVMPFWASDMTYMMQIDDHLFYSRD